MDGFTAFLIILLVIIILRIIHRYNVITTLSKKVKQSKSTIDVYLQQRFDLIPNLVETVKGYMNYEKETLTQIVELRTQYNNTKDLKISEELNEKIDRILITAENYPELQASKQFLNLQRNLVKMESQLQAARRAYNMDATNYNTKISVVPYNIFARIFGFREEPLFKAELEAKSNVSAKL